MKTVRHVLQITRSALSLFALRKMITKNVGQKGFSENENRNTKLPIYIISVQIQFSVHVLVYTLNAISSVYA